MTSSFGGIQGTLSTPPHSYDHLHPYSDRRLHLWSRCVDAQLSCCRSCAGHMSCANKRQLMVWKGPFQGAYLVGVCMKRQKKSRIIWSVPAAHTLPGMMDDPGSFSGSSSSPSPQRGPLLSSRMSFAILNLHARRSDSGPMYDIMYGSIHGDAS